MPMPTPAIKQASKMPGVAENENEISCHVWKFIIETRWVVSRSANAIPTIPPDTARTVDSSTKDVRIWKREKPSARSVPTSRLR